MVRKWSQTFLHLSPIRWNTLDSKGQLQNGIPNFEMVLTCFLKTYLCFVSKMLRSKGTKRDTYCRKQATVKEGTLFGVIVVYWDSSVLRRVAWFPFLDEFRPGMPVIFSDPPFTFRNFLSGEGCDCRFFPQRGGVRLQDFRREAPEIGGEGGG